MHTVLRVTILVRQSTQSARGNLQRHKALQILNAIGIWQNHRYGDRLSDVVTGDPGVKYAINTGAMIQEVPRSPPGSTPLSRLTEGRPCPAIRLDKELIECVPGNLPGFRL